MNPIAIIDCAIKSPSYPCMNTLVEKFNFPFTYHWVGVYGVESLDKIKEASGYIIFGSHSNVFEKLEWQVTLAKLMKEKIENNIPVLGICFGHQLMAHAFGATIELINSENIPNQGTRSQKILNNIHGLKKGDEFSTFVTHQYEVKNLPKDFIHLSTSKDCFFDGLAHKKYPYLSFQGHPEASMNFVKSNINIVLNKEEITKAQEGGDFIVSKFLKLVKEANR